MELSLLRTFAPGNESTMVWNFRSLELSLPGAKVPRTFARSKELSLCGTFAPVSLLNEYYAADDAYYNNDSGDRHSASTTVARQAYSE